MRNAAPALKAWLAANNVAFRADLFTITLIDGVTIYRWTGAEGLLVYGGNAFYPAGANGPHAVRGPYSCSSKLIIDTLDLTLTGGQSFLIGGKSLQLLGAQGYFNGARVKVDHVIGADPNGAISGTAGGVIDSFFEGRIAGVEPKGPSLLMHAKSELVVLNQLLPRFLLQHQCGNAVYDVNCAASLGGSAAMRASFTLSGAADGTPGRSSIHTSSAAPTAKSAGYFNLGVLRFTSGANNGVGRAVQSWDGHTFTMALPFPAAPAAGDTFTVYPGCNRSSADCLNKFNNLAQNRGYPHMPSPETGSWYA